MRRVVVTGLGMVNALGCGVEDNWRRILNSECGISRIERFDVSDLPAKIAGQIPTDGGERSFNADDWIPTKDQRRMDDFIIYGIAAAQQAIDDSGWVAETDEQKWRTGVLIGSGIGGLPEISKGTMLVENGGIRKLSPFFIPASLINLVSGPHGTKF